MITIYLKQYNKIVRNADVRLFDDLGYDDILWIDLLSPTIKEQKAVENFMEINLQTRQQVEEIGRKLDDLRNGASLSEGGGNPSSGTSSESGER